ncbi:MAG: DNA helicase UvrD [Gammaproteobacteria bacterium]|nr:DNA helicase UvrD [Gammaproteobacteria bacterium]
MPIGDEMTAPGGAVLEVVERTELRPAHDERGWDSRRSLVHRFSPPPIWIESLRELLETLDDAEDPLRSLLAAEQADHDAMARRQREVLTQMALRDQPILDQFQDEIFRLPLEDCLVLLGPPGTGKTTTLIRRLGQKLDLAALEAEELVVIEQMGPNAIPHTVSWRMFSPTELLRQYVKEAFAREGVPAPDANIRTWDEFRLELARGSLRLLRSAQRPQGLVMQRNDGYLMEGTCDSVTGWYDDFERWQRHDFSSRRILANVEVLRGLLEGDALKRVEDLAASIDSVDPADVEALVRRLEGRAPSWAQMMESLQASSRDIIRHRLTEHLREDDGFLKGIADFLETLQEIGEESDDDGSGADDSDRDPDDEDEGAAVAQAGRLTRAQHAYQAAVRADARAASLGRSLRKGSRSAALIDWIGNCGLSTKERERVGRNLRLVSALRPLLNPVRPYTREVAARYQRFRRTRQSEGQWYVEGRVVRGEVGPLEVDMILLALLRFCREERQSRAGRRSLESAFWAQLPTIPYRNQIFVDEATDFSPVQLACMLALTHPGARSFFACGDFNQRLTAWGTRSEEEIEWARAQIPTMPPVGFRHLSTGYRHSPQLLDLAREIVRVSGEGGLEVELPDGATSAGFAPVLAEHTAGGAISNWIADRILEIERFGGELPSIAVLVPEEPQVGVMAEELGRAMAPHNVNVVACYAGQAIGQENDVRVFDAQHIKGLEFEAVFFADVDRLAELYPRLFTKFLYVGATRAATYFGLTSAGPMPSALSELRTIFATKFLAAEAYGNEGASNGNI